MMGTFLTRALVLALGYAYPAYECFKIVERNKPEIERLRFWCQYWILVAALTVFERVGDTFISWLPMYSEAKLAFFIYLWYPKTMGTTYVYETFLRPYVVKHETEIDRNLLELRTRAGDVLVSYCQKAATYGQTRFMEILQYVASQSKTPRPRQPLRRQQQARPPAAEAQQPQSPKLRPPPIPNKNLVQEGSPAPVPAVVQSQTPASSSQASTSVATHLASGKADPVHVEATNIPIKGEATLPQETILEETIRITRSRLRKNRCAAVAMPTGSVVANQNH